MTEPKIHPNIVFSQDILKELQRVLEKYRSAKLFMLTDTNTEQFCLPQIQRLVDAYHIKHLMINAGEENKNIQSVEKIWNFLAQNSADRNSLLINLGGGMLTDVGGFAASTFKRGIDFMNIPTTLLAQVDASLGGKTGVNFDGIKNLVGSFSHPIATLINTNFLQTLDRRNFFSGYAEMFKHAFIHNQQHLEELQRFDLQRVDYDKLQEIIGHSVSIKEWFVENDPEEKNIRKALNFGHTIGHAFESLALLKKQPILHGYAVAYGMMVELFLSVKKCGFDAQEYSIWVDKLMLRYDKFEITENDYPMLFKFMKQDKKNQLGKINFTLIPGIGEYAINQPCTREEVYEALEYYRTLNRYV